MLNSDAAAVARRNASECISYTRRPGELRRSCGGRRRPSKSLSILARWWAASMDDAAIFF